MRYSDKTVYIGGNMTWEEITKKYEQDKRAAKEVKTPKLPRNWDALVRSTDKLVWLFMLSNARSPARNG